jgi:hypothetical protein
MGKKERRPGDPYEVGYGKPPQAYQFKRGQSGNPNGQPRKTKSGQTDVAGILGEPLTVTTAGTSQKMAPFEVSVRQLVNRALSKHDLKAVLEFVGLCETYGIVAPMPPPEGPGPILVVPKTWDWDEWMRMFEKHGPPPWPGERSGLPAECGVGRARKEP